MDRPLPHSYPPSLPPPHPAVRTVFPIGTAIRTLSAVTDTRPPPPLLFLRLFQRQKEKSSSSSSSSSSRQTDRQTDSCGGLKKSCNPLSASHIHRQECAAPTTIPPGFPCRWRRSQRFQSIRSTIPSTGALHPPPQRLIPAEASSSSSSSSNNSSSSHSRHHRQEDLWLPELAIPADFSCHPPRWISTDSSYTTTRWRNVSATLIRRLSFRTPRRAEDRGDRGRLRCRRPRRWRSISAGCLTI